jgi:hypothetical protein
MADVLALFSLAALLAAAWLFTRLLRPDTRTGALLIVPLLFAAFIVGLGYLLSLAHVLGQLVWWATGSLALLVVLLVPMWLIPAWRAVCFRPLSLPHDIEARIRAAGTRGFDLRLLIVTGCGVALVALLTFIRVLSFEPATVDAMTYHLSRMAQYLQHNSLAPFGAGYWAQELHPKVATILHLYAYLVSEKMANLTQLVQFIAYGAAMLSLYGIARLLGAARRNSVFAALVFGLLIIVIMEAATAQNDLILAAFLSISLFLLLCYRTYSRPLYLVCAALAFSLAAGVKGTVLTALPSLFIVTAAVLLPPLPVRARRDLTIGLGALLLFLLVMTLPSGYLENWQRFGHPLGTLAVRQRHSFTGASPARMLTGGGLNLLRYGCEFLSPDGLPPIAPVLALDRALLLPGHLLQQAGVPLESSIGTRWPFRFQLKDTTIASENTSYWGLLGILLVWPAVFLLLFNRRQSIIMRAFAAAALVFFVVQAFVSPFDLFRGRYFIIGAIFAVPAVAVWPLVPRTLLGRGYLGLAVMLGCLSALSAAVLSHGTSFIPVRFGKVTIPSTFTLDRSSQLVRQYPEMFLLLFEAIVPKDAVVAVDVARPLPEFPFFGEGLTRRIISIVRYTDGRHPIPPEADFLICDEESPYFKNGGDPLLLNHPNLGTILLQSLR